MASEDLNRVELYDLASDPFEVVELARREPEIRDRLLAQLREIRQSVHTDPLRPPLSIDQARFRGD